MPNTIQATLRKIYLYHALDDFVLLYPLYLVFMSDKGLSAFQISTLLMIWSTTDIIVNIPTGVLADKYSRKLILGIGQLLKAAAFTVWFIWPTYVGFALGFIFWGVGGALAGGTFEALVYDELRAVDQQKHYVKVIGRARSYALMANFVSTALAGAAIMLGYPFIFEASVLTVIVSSLFVFTLPETPRFEPVADNRYFSMLGQGIKEAVHNKTILGIVLLGGFIGAIYGSLEEYVPLFVKDVGVSPSIVPIAVASTIAAAALASFVAYRYEKLSTRTFMIALVMAGALLLAAGAFANYGAIVLLIAYTFLIKLLEVIYEGKLQHSISGGLRATISSVGEFSVEVLAIMIYFVYGLTTQQSSNFGAFKVFGGIVIFVALFYLFIAPRVLSKRSINDSMNKLSS